MLYHSQLKIYLKVNFRPRFSDVSARATVAVALGTYYAQGVDNGAFHTLGIISIFTPLMKLTCGALEPYHYSFSYCEATPVHTQKIAYSLSLFCVRIEASLCRYC